MGPCLPGTLYITRQAHIMEFITSTTIATVSAIDTAADFLSTIPSRSQRFAHQVATADTSVWAARIERTIRVSAALFAFLFVIGSITAEALYDIGRQFRRALDARNDQLAAFWVRLWVAQPTAPGAIVLAHVPATTEVTAVHRLPVLPLLLAATPAPFALLAPAAAPARPARRRSAVKPVASPTPTPQAAKPRPARRSRRAAVAMAAA